ncbi:MAG: hypothetical protein Q9219_000635 [cf. Caloplaca sp. 3 TL-2023]
MPHDSIPPIHITPNQLVSVSDPPDPASPKQPLHVDLTSTASQAFCAPTTSAPMYPPGLSIPPTSPRSGRRILPITNSFLEYRSRGPRLKIATPRTKRIKPSFGLPPDYIEWHPTTVIFEYQHQRGLPFSAPLKSLCSTFNRLRPQQWSRVMKKGHQNRVEWLYWYWYERARVRKEHMKKQREETAMAREQVKKQMDEEAAPNQHQAAQKKAEQQEWDALTDEEKDIILTLEFEMEQEVEESKIAVKQEPKLTEDSSAGDVS